MAAEYALVFVAGFAGSAHCLGMCGGFACALGADRRGRAASVLRHLLYNGGRVVAYVFLGALAGAFGAALLAPATSLAAAQSLLSLAAGALIVLMAAQLLGLRATAPRPSATLQAVTVPVTALLHAPQRTAPLAFGVANGLLPCPLVYAFLAKAAATAAVPQAALIMLFFGLGTFPAMLLAGGTGRLLAPLWRRHGVRIAGVFLLLFGVFTLVRAVLPYAAPMGHG